MYRRNKILGSYFHPSPAFRHPQDAKDVLESNLINKKLYYRSYVDCGDTLYVIVNENLSKIKAFIRTGTFLPAITASDQLSNAGSNRRSLGLALLRQLLGSSAISGLGLYKSINTIKAVFIKIN